MGKFCEFRQWLEVNTDYTKPTKSNIVSRLKRADGIMPISKEPIYLFDLSQTIEFQELTVSVKSQIRKAVKLYIRFKENEEK